MSVAKTANEASVLKRMASILNLFSEGRTSITIDEVGEAIGVSPATAYRYVGELGGIGLLSRVSGRYVLGPKIIELEYLIRSYDPVIKSGEEIMTGMADMTGCHVLLCNIYDETIVNVFHAEGKDSLKVTFTKGKQMPLFRGSQARVILASLDRRKLRRLYDKHLENPDLMTLGRDWPSFRASFNAFVARDTTSRAMSSTPTRPALRPLYSMRTTKFWEALCWSSRPRAHPGLARPLWFRSWSRMPGRSRVALPVSRNVQLILDRLTAARG